MADGGSAGREYALQTGRYVVSIASSVMGFAKVSGMKLFADSFSAVNEGGCDAPYFVQGPRKEMNTLTFEKGVLIDGRSKKANGDLTKLAANGGLTNLIIMIMGGDGRIRKAYCAGYAVVREITLSDLDAQNMSPLIQTMTLGYDLLAPVEEKKFSELENRMAAGQSRSGKPAAQAGASEEALPSQIAKAESRNRKAAEEKAELERKQKELDRASLERKESRVEF